MAYQDAVQYALNNTDPTETLVISTADHGHGITFNGKCGRGSSVTGLCMEINSKGEMHGTEPMLAADGKTYSVISVSNGPGSILYVSAVLSTSWTAVRVLCLLFSILIEYFAFGGDLGFI